MAATPATNPTRSWLRNDVIDALRALAILTVLMNHTEMRLLFAHVPWMKGHSPNLITALVWQGQRGVQLFFAISGYLITSTAIRRWGSLANLRLRDFYLIRFARIAPLLLTLLAVLSVLHLAHVHDYVISKKAGGLPAALFAALTFHVGLLEATRGYLPGAWDILWSLGVEEVFYFGFPLAARYLSRPRLLIPLLAVFAVLGPIARAIFTRHNEVWHEYSYLGGMDAIALGCLTAMLLASRTPAPRTRMLLAGAGTVAIVFVFAFPINPAMRWLETHGLDMTLVALAACALFAAFAQTTRRAPRLLTPLLALGRRSYEVYLTHMFLVFALFAGFRALGKPLHLVAPLFLAVIIAAGLLGEFVGRFYSEPLNQLLRRRFRDDPAHLGAAVPSN